MATPRVLAETVLVNYLDSSGLAAQVLPGCSAVDKDPPLVVCTATSWEDEGINLGVFNVETKIEIKFRAGNKDAFDALCLAVYNLLWLDNDALSTALNAAIEGGGVHVFGVANPHKGSFATEGDVWIETIELGLVLEATA